MLIAKALTYRHEQQIYTFSFEIKQGEIVSICGESGAGKSTLLALISGLLEPESGTLQFHQDSLLSLTAYKRPLSILFQEHNVFEHLSVFDNIALGLSPSGRLSASQKQCLESAAERVGLSSLLNRLPGQLSGGQKQRIALARCFARKQPILLLDEPFSSLDPSLRQDMLNEVQRLAKEENISVLMVTHHPEEAARIADRTLMIAKGQIQIL